MQTRKLSLAAAALMPLVWLTGCSGGAEVDDYYQPAMHWERYPIEVAKGSVRLDVTTRRSELNPRQRDAVVKFAQQVISSSAAQVVVRRPSGTNADAVAERVTALLVDTGVPLETIVHSQGGGRGAPVVVTFERKFAVTAECGDWSEDLAVTGQNTPPPDFGCATQHNIAAVVANPEDFKSPRAAAPADPMRRYQVFVDYRKPKSTATSTSASESQTVSDVAE